jgi:anti-anti-sigma factor
LVSLGFEGMSPTSVEIDDHRPADMAGEEAFMDSNTQQFDQVDVWSVGEKLGPAEVAELKPGWIERLAQGRRLIVIDLAKLESIGSPGLRALLEVRDLARSNHGDVRIASMSPRVKAAFDLIRYTQLFMIYDDVETAKASFTGMDPVESFWLSSQSLGLVDVVKVSGRMEAGQAWQLGHILHGLLDQGRCRIVLDLTELTYLEHKGLRVIYDFSMIAKNTNTGDVYLRNDGDLILSGMPTQIKEALKVSGLALLFTFSDDVTKAIKSFGAASEGQEIS